ncbi:hypothetical protein FQR65_LT17641 [Abscondita terminalis]|nr:hypothetical protein FQR65_LT17641 [Abscondita terminalis]
MKTLGLSLPPAPAPLGIYKPFLVDGKYLYLSGHGPVQNDKSLIIGRIGEDMDIEQGKLAARQVGLTMLSTIITNFNSLNNVKRVVKVLGMVNCTQDFLRHPYVINGCSELFAEVWGVENGIGVRSAVGMGSLPDNIPVELIAAVNGDVSKLRPHVKTHKLGEILELFKVYGINKVKCATVSEAELCAIHGIKNILLAYQPVGQVKQNRWLTLIQKYPEISFSTIVDNLEVTNELSKLGQSKNEIFSVYLDINTGMNRTGVDFKSNWDDLLFTIHGLPNIQLLGLHIYDGHLHGTENERIHLASETFAVIKEKIHNVEQRLNTKMKIVAGGSGTFPFYATAENVECSPGTFVFGDIN